MRYSPGIGSLPALSARVRAQAAEAGAAEGSPPDWRTAILETALGFDPEELSDQDRRLVRRFSLLSTTGRQLFATAAAVLEQRSRWSWSLYGNAADRELANQWAKRTSSLPFLTSGDKDESPLIVALRAEVIRLSQVVNRYESYTREDVTRQLRAVVLPEAAGLNLDRLEARRADDDGPVSQKEAWALFRRGVRRLHEQGMIRDPARCDLVELLLADRLYRRISRGSAEGNRESTPQPAEPPADSSRADPE